MDAVATPSLTLRTTATAAEVSARRRQEAALSAGLASDVVEAHHGEGEREEDGTGAFASVAKVLAHPLRVRLLVTLAELAEAGPKRLSIHLNERLGNVSYHVRYLESRGVIELVGTRPRRGAIEHIYALKDPLRAAIVAIRTEPTHAETGNLWATATLAALVAQSELQRGDLHHLLVTQPQAMTDIGKALADTTRVQVLGVLVADPGLTAHTIACRLGVEPDSVRTRLRTLAKAGLVVRKGSQWSLTPQGAEALAGTHNLLASRCENADAEVHE